MRKTEEICSAKLRSESQNKLLLQDRDLLKFLRIMGDDNRLRILSLLKSGEHCVCEISPSLNLAQNLVSSHLKIMLDFGLLENRQEWKRNYYTVNSKTFKLYNSRLIKFLKNYEH